MGSKFPDPLPATDEDAVELPHWLEWIFKAVVVMSAGWLSQWLTPNHNATGDGAMIFTIFGMYMHDRAKLKAKGLL